LYTSQNIMRAIKLRRMRWAGHVAWMGRTRNACNILVGELEGKRPLRSPRRKWEMILDWILGTKGGRVWTWDSSDSG